MMKHRAMIFSPALTDEQVDRIVDFLEHLEYAKGAILEELPLKGDGYQLFREDLRQGVPQ